MKSMKQIRGASVACLLAVPLILSSCSLFGSESASVDPPPSEVEAQMLQVSGETTLDTGVLGPVAKEDAQTAATSGERSGNSDSGSRTTVFLEDNNGLLAPVSLSLPKSDETTMLKDSLTALVSKGAYASLLPTGFEGLLPTGTEVKNVTVDKASGLAVVEFNSDFNAYDAANEREILEAITWTLTGESGIKGVQLWVDGKKLTEMPLKGTPLDRPLSRSMGINLPKHSQLLMNSSAVTVYFSAASPDGIQYYVPVTRFVPAGQDTLKAALSELIAGPESGDGLEMVMTQGTVLDSVEAGQNGVVTVSLTDDMFADGTGVPTEMLESVVLTVAQNTEDALVQIRMNGKETVTGTDNVDYGKPVSAPEYVNELPL
ncbi:GerMN domain-containing protein [Paenibacillus sp. 19GGS1-52]|uniref:GerMN domain-containing protein n=1 Tax=Paenibacillus sp. 19GGS1-52 TaxID=2758563 RepID=UPI001EFB07B9|nr:GerMN domain-containing protein [Paenibacillus sp. 19GGS1-52]ULO10237.1 GerMN domain-containing protein [Paenibacillus sp. 19GGS1-52]